MNCPDSIVFIDDYYSVNTIRHHDESICLNVLISVRDIIPALNDDLPKAIRVHFAVDNLPKDALPPLHAHRHQIRAGPRVIVISQPNRAAVIFVRVVWHGHAKLRHIYRLPIRAPLRSILICRTNAAELVQDFREKIVQAFQSARVFDYTHYLEIQFIDAFGKGRTETAFVIFY